MEIQKIQTEFGVWFLQNKRVALCRVIHDYKQEIKNRKSNYILQLEFSDVYMIALNI